MTTKTTTDKKGDKPKISFVDGVFITPPGEASYVSLDKPNSMYSNYEVTITWEKNDPEFVAFKKRIDEAESKKVAEMLAAEIADATAKLKAAQSNLKAKPGKPAEAAVKSAEAALRAAQAKKYKGEARMWKVGKTYDAETKTSYEDDTKIAAQFKMTPNDGRWPDTFLGISDTDRNTVPPEKLWSGDIIRAAFSLGGFNTNLGLGCKPYLKEIQRVRRKSGGGGGGPAPKGGSWFETTSSASTPDVDDLPTLGDTDDLLAG